jgi:calcium-dependent protein kinase
MKKVLKGKYSFVGDNWMNVSKEAKDLITRMLAYNPKDRISALEALNHPWIISFSKVDKTLHKAIALKSLMHLKKFKAEEKLKQAAMSFIVTQLMTEKDKANLQEIFQAIDTNGDGKLSKQELLDGCMRVFGESMSTEQIDAIFKKVDVDGNGTIDYHEFLLATANEDAIMSTKNLKEAFNYMDKDGSGEITVKEIKEALGHNQTISDDVWNQIIAEADKNGDGVISFDEFMIMMKNLK